MKRIAIFSAVILMVAAGGAWYAFHRRLAPAPGPSEAREERNARPRASDVQVFLPGVNEITAEDSGKGFFYRTTDRFSVVLDAARHPPQNTKCESDILGRISNSPAGAPPLEAVRFEAVRAGRCILANGDFEVAIAVGDLSFCAQVVTPAKNPLTGETRNFPTPCDVPPGWEKIAASAPAPGTLAGQVTIGPICPVERQDQPCPPSPELFLQQKILVYDADRTRLVAEIVPGTDGSYQKGLPPGTYSVVVKHTGIRGENPPETVRIASGQTAILDISIDTGIR